MNFFSIKCMYPGHGPSAGIKWIESLSKCLEQPKVWPFHYGLQSSNPGLQIHHKGTVSAWASTVFCFPITSFSQMVESTMLKLPWNMERFLKGISKPLFPHFGNISEMQAVPPRREFLVLTCWNCGGRVNIWWCRCCGPLTWLCWGGPRVPECRQRLNSCQHWIPKDPTRSWWISVRLRAAQ